MTTEKQPIEAPFKKGQRVRYLANYTSTYGTVLYVTEDGGLVIQWDDGLIDEAFNLYHYSEFIAENADG